jgi:hypothetical protein
MSGAKWKRIMSPPCKCQQARAETLLILQAGLAVCHGAAHKFADMPQK